MAATLLANSLKVTTLVIIMIEDSDLYLIVHKVTVFTKLKLDQKQLDFTNQ